MNDKFILDACCGGKMFWFNKNHPNTLYIDNRIAKKGHNPYRPNHCVIPDKVVDFCNMPFPDKSFKLVVFDPPHFITEKDETNTTKLYGHLKKESWANDIRRGFNECWRVLEDYGVLIFKWHEANRTTSEVLKIIDKVPLFGNRQGTKLKTIWLTFMKIPQQAKNGDIAQRDPIDNKFVEFDLIHFARWCKSNNLDPDNLMPKHVHDWLNEIDDGDHFGC